MCTLVSRVFHALLTNLSYRVVGRGRREESMRNPLVRSRRHAAAPIQVAAVCYRRKASSIEFLLVRTSSGRWTFPKGHHEAGLSRAEVAALEAFEEGGVRGSVDSRPLGSYLHRKESLSGYATKDLTVLAFLLEVEKSVLPSESHRTPRWLTASDAKQRLAQGRPTKYRVSIERVFDSAVRKINRKRS
jgi:8-oxo-dGTP pyrophosphatase MutT (NUDIX family)